MGLMVGGATGSVCPESDGAELPFRPDRFLVLPRDGAGGPVLTALHARHQAVVERWFPALAGLQIVRLPEGAGLPAIIQEYRESAAIVFAEPDYLVRYTGFADDPRFADGSQWGLHNSGQGGSVPDVDVDAPEAWDIRSDASSVIVAVIDTGLWSTHEDLRDNLWTNPGEVPGNGLDDDGNGYVDDVHGLNALTGTGATGDIAGHGTHVAGIIGARGNNGKGIAGVAWKARLMPCRFTDSSGNGSIADAITCLEYARSMGARVINASWVTTEASKSLELAIAGAREDGLIIVAGAGNDSVDLDRVPYYPASLPLDNIVSVAAGDCQDHLWECSNFGTSSVDLVAPGVDVYSTFFIADNNYVTMTGTSQATAFVAGAAALVWAEWPTASYGEVIDRLLYGSVPVPAFRGRCQTGARLNLRGALDPSPPPIWPLQPVAAAGNQGGPFTYDPQSFVILNRGAEALEWSAATTTWLEVSPRSGTIAPTQKTSVTVAFNGQAKALPPGRHANRVDFILRPGDQSLQIPWTLDVYVAAVLRVSRPEPVGSAVQLSLKGHPAATYVAEGSSDLLKWSRVATNTLPAEGELAPFCTLPGTARRQYYRAWVVSPP